MIAPEDIAVIKKKALTGVMALTTRTFLLQIIAFISTFLLTVFLDPDIFGVFFLVSAMISFLSYFSDIGLAAALIQKKESLTKRDLATTFTIQQLIVVCIVIVCWFLSPYLSNWYGINSNGLWLLRALLVSFFLSSLKTIPSILLERDLDFGKLVLPQVLETIGFYGVATYLAWQGAGVWSFTWAVLVRGFVGLVAMYIIKPWKIQICIDKTVLRRLLSYGFPFQLNSLLALLKDDLLTLMVGQFLPAKEIGYIGWAKKWAEIPLRLIMDSAIRVTFPAYSRIQHDKEALGRGIERTLFTVLALVLPVTISMIFFVKPIALLIPKYAKWEPAFLSFSVFALVSVFASISTPLTNALNAVGKIKNTLFFMIFWTILTWISTFIGIGYFGFVGVPLALLFVATTVPIVIIVTKKYAYFSMKRVLFGPMTGGVVLSVCYGLLFQFIPNMIVAYIGVGIMGVILYCVVLWTVDKAHIHNLLNDFKGVIPWHR